MSPRIVLLLVCSSAALGCEPKQGVATAPATPQVASSSPADRHVYRFDFVLTGGDPGAATTTSFTLNLSELEKGEVVIGKNVPLGNGTPPMPSMPPGSPAPPPPQVSARQDVGVKVAAQFRMVGDDVLLDVNSEMSSFEAPAVRKALTRGAVLAAPGKPALISLLEDDHRRYQLTVTSTKLR